VDVFDLLLMTFIAAALTDLATGLGPVPFFFLPSFSPRVAGLLTASAGGMMVAASLVQLVGEGMERAPGWRAWEVAFGLAVGAAFFALASRWLDRHEKFDIGRLRERGGAGAILIVAAMTVHSLPEGVGVGVGYGTGDYAFGGTIALAIAVHNIPEGVAIALALRPRGVSTWACIGWAVFSSIPQPVAAVPAAWAVWISEPLLPVGMGFAAGAMTHLVVSQLLPEATERAGAAQTATAFAAGLVAMVLLGAVLGVG